MKIIPHDPAKESPPDNDMVIVGLIDHEETYAAQYCEDTLSFKHNYYIGELAAHYQSEEISVWFKVPTYQELLAALRQEATP